MKNKLIILLLVLAMLLISCTSQNKQIVTINKSIEKATPLTEQVTNETIIENYISSFLTKGYSKYYIINCVECEILSQEVENGKLEAVIHTNMDTNNPLKNPDTVPYIQEAKEKAYKENDPEMKHILQQQYMTLYSEYLKPTESNFAFKLTAELKDGKINEDTIQLFIETDVANGVKYIPAEEILPKN
ncbi:MAG TPA: hypothetical protein VEF53_17530 [Patescibacteria group bacterium]|nr:hypothetical protein [Patescibacteria group bacterium]